MRTPKQDLTYQKQRQEEFRKQGLCWRCGQNKPEPPRSNQECNACLDRGKLAYRKRRSNPYLRAKDCRRARQYYQTLRQNAINHYGGKCICCGELEYAFLDFDHINGGGTKHHKQINFAIVHWLIKNKYPKSIRILCCNCNQGRQRNGGICPHEEMRNGSLRNDEDSYVCP